MAISHAQPGEVSDCEFSPRPSDQVDFFPQLEIGQIANAVILNFCEIEMDDRQARLMVTA